MLSDGSGVYSFPSLGAGGTYIVTPTKAPLSPGAAGIDTADAIRIQRHFLGLSLLTGCSLSAGDVNGDGNVTTTDVVAVERFFLGYTSGTGNVGKYQFSPPAFVYPNLGSDQGNSFTGLIFGDVASPFAD